MRDSEQERPMSEPILNKFLTERDKAVFAAGGFGARAGYRLPAGLFDRPAGSPAPAVKVVAE